jgi:acyl-coenzyme A thioesterase PaaI-like protein
MRNPVSLSKKYLHWLPEAKRLEWYPPWWLMHIKVIEIANNWRRIRIRLPLTWVAKNMGNSMFGGFQASLADPIAPLACAKVFSGYSVWTRHLSVDFIRPGNTDLELRFDFPEETEEKIQKQLAKKGRSTPSFTYGLYTSDNKLCTKIICTVAIRPKGYSAKKLASVRKPVEQYYDNLK